MRDQGTKHWIIADTHFGHERIKIFENRPENFEDQILKNLRSNIEEDSVLIHLGDFCIGDDVLWQSAFMRNVKGRKVLVRGNHDRKSISWYYRHGWDFVADEVTLNIHGAELLFTHQPVMFPGTKLNIHGHLHRKSHQHSRSIFLDKSHCLVYIEHNYLPISLRSIVEKQNLKEGVCK